MAPQEHQRRKVGRANWVVGDTLWAFANGRKDDWDQHLPPADFAINNVASTLGGELTPSFIDRRRGAHSHLPLSQPQDGRYAGESPAHLSGRMLEMEMAEWAILLEAQTARKSWTRGG